MAAKRPNIIADVVVSSPAIAIIIIIIINLYIQGESRHGLHNCWNAIESVSFLHFSFASYLVNYSFTYAPN